MECRERMLSSGDDVQLVDFFFTAETILEVDNGKAPWNQT